MTYWLTLIPVFLVILLLPRFGLVAQFRRSKTERQREWVEDALKHLLEREQSGAHATPETSSQALNIPVRRTRALIASMEAQGLVELRGDQIHLTPDGERWALHVLRAHRLWERYLADEARMPLTGIHREAHRREHHLTSEDLDALEAALGYPTRDPHGDPIPTTQGVPDGAQAIPLNEWPLDTPAQVVHLEDEPEIAYQQILASGLRLGQVVRLLEKDATRYVLSDGENEYRLAPTIAANIYVQPLTKEPRRLEEAITLEKLSPQQRARILALDEAVQGFTRRRLLDLGLTPGTEIHVALDNFFGDPRAYRVRGTLIALRRDQAAQVWVKPEKMN